MTNNNKTIWQKLQTIDQRILYLLFFIVVIPPLLIPLNLPVPIGPHSTALYNKIESLQPGDVVLFDFSYMWSFNGIHAKAQLAVGRHLFSIPGIKILMVTFFSADGALCYNAFLNDLKPAVNYPDKKVGIDYLWLGYVTGQEAAIIAFADDCWATVPTAADGKLVKDVYPEFFNAVKNAEDFALVMEGGGHGGVNGFATGGYLKSFGIKYNSWLAYNMDPSCIAEFYAYYPDTIKSLISGNLGAAEYEKLIGQTGGALLYTDAAGTTHFFTLIIVILANVGYFMERQSSRTKKETTVSRS